MPPGAPSTGAPQEGSAAITLVVAAALSLVVFVSLANVVTTLSTRHAVRAALDEAVRVGSRSDAPIADCQARAREVLRGLLGPAARRGVAVSCGSGGDPETVQARADVRIVPWWPGLPTWSFSVEATALKEVLR